MQASSRRTTGWCSTYSRPSSPSRSRSIAAPPGSTDRGRQSLHASEERTGMKSGTTSFTRRRLGALGVGAVLAAGMPRDGAAQSGGFPARNFRVVIPTGQGGGADRLARSFDDGWSKLLGGRQFEYEFYPGAAG